MVFVVKIIMADESPIRFTLLDGTAVSVKKVAGNKKYDFEMKLPNGNRKTFVWSDNDGNEFSNKRGEKDAQIHESVQQFKKLRT